MTDWSKKLLTWVDIETTGTDIDRDFLLELAVVITDAKFNELESHSWVIRPLNQLWVSRMPEVVVDMHSQNGLITDVLKKGAPARIVFNELGDLLQDAFSFADYGLDEKRPFVMAGSGIGPFDKPFLFREARDIGMDLGNWFEYYVLDTGVIRRFLELCGREDFIPSDKANENLKTHRAMEDVRLHLAEARSYYNLLSRVELVWSE